MLHPELRSVPMAVCGDPESRRGIILAKNELAKGYGIKTAETIWQAKRKCPQLVRLGLWLRATAMASFIFMPREKSLKGFFSGRPKRVR